MTLDWCSEGSISKFDYLLCWTYILVMYPISITKTFIFLTHQVSDICVPTRANKNTFAISIHISVLYYCQMINTNYTQYSCCRQHVCKIRFLVSFWKSFGFHDTILITNTVLQFHLVSWLYDDTEMQQLKMLRHQESKEEEVFLAGKV